MKSSKNAWSVSRSHSSHKYRCCAFFNGRCWCCALFSGRCWCCTLFTGRRHLNSMGDGKNSMYLIESCNKIWLMAFTERVRRRAIHSINFPIRRGQYNDVLSTTLSHHAWKTLFMAAAVISEPFQNGAALRSTRCEVHRVL